MKHAEVKPTDTIILSKTVRKKGYSIDDAPDHDSGMFESTLEELFNPEFGANHQHPEDSYFMPGRHIDKIYRYNVQDCQFDHKDQFRFCLIPIDIDIKDASGRTTWEDTGLNALPFLRHIRKCSTIVDCFATTNCTSRGGVRIVFVLDRYVNALQWRFLYNKVVNDLAEDLDGEFGKYGKLEFTIDDLEFVLDPRNPGSLTRVPNGFRDKKPVVETDYFEECNSQLTFLPIDWFGELDELEPQVLIRTGYHTVNLNIQRPVILEKLPMFLEPFQWPNNEPPVQGEREVALFQAVGRAKYQYTDRLTPGQYYTYFFDAVDSMDSLGAVIHPLDQLWLKIIRNFYQRSEATTQPGKKLDHIHLNNSGGVAFFPAIDFDDVLQPAEVYSYAKREQKQVIKELLAMESGTVFLNPPPGAGKSTAALTLLKEKGGIYIAPSNKQIKDITKRLQCYYNIVLSYKELISLVCSHDPQAKIIILGKYEEHNAAYKEAICNVAMLNDEDPDGKFNPRMIMRNGTFYRVKSFPQYIEDQFPIESEKIHKENHKRIFNMEKGHLTLITKDKFLTLMLRDKTHALPLDHPIIYDEAEPEDIVDPELYLNADPVQVYGVSCQPNMEINIDNQSKFIEFLKQRPTIFINANKGLDRALRFNGFTDVKVYGGDMRPVFDNDLHIVLTPDLKAGYTSHRNDDDETETSPRALYAAQVNPNTYTLFTNGKDVKGNKLSTDNLKRVIGSNDYINSRVIAIITLPTPEQVAELCFCTGMNAKAAKNLIFENLVNQVISRNVGYRGFLVTNEVRTKDLHQIKAAHANEHILVLPESILDDDIELIVKTTKVWTTSSKSIPPQIKPYLKAIPLEAKARAQLYNVAPGTHTTLRRIADGIGASCKSVSFILAELKKDPMLADFHFIARKNVGTLRLRNVVERFETIAVLVKESFKEIINFFKFTDFVKLLIAKTSKAYIQNLSIKSLKIYVRQEAFRYDYRVIVKRDVEYLVRTGAEDLFRA